MGFAEGNYMPGTNASGMVFLGKKRWSQTSRGMTRKEGAEAGLVSIHVYREGILVHHVVRDLC
jgi:hypothetical protein